MSSTPPRGVDRNRRAPSTRALVVAGLLVALLLAGFVSYYASSSPDGLNRVAEDKGFADTETRHAASDSPFAGYETRGVDNGRLSGGFAGVAGSLLVLVLAGGLVLVVRRRGGNAPGADDADDRATSGAPPHGE